jgi:phosphatidylserine/phosphatidylglycerophosphate/cardiolipin synthase-like enzyme
MRKYFFLLLNGILLIIIYTRNANAVEKSYLNLSDKCQTVILTNDNYFPTLLKCIDEAQNEILISMFSFKAGRHKNSYPDRILIHLAKAAQRGIKVYIILEDTGNIHDEITDRNRQTGNLLARKGIKVYYDNARTTTHTKLIVIDQRLIFLGSHNFTQAALKYNNEISVLMNRPDLAKNVRNYILKIIKEGQ